MTSGGFVYDHPECVPDCQVIWKDAYKDFREFARNLDPKELLSYQASLEGSERGSDATRVFLQIACDYVPRISCMQLSPYVHARCFGSWLVRNGTLANGKPRFGIALDSSACFDGIESNRRCPDQGIAAREPDWVPPGIPDPGVTNVVPAFSVGSPSAKCRTSADPDRRMDSMMRRVRVRLAHLILHEAAHIKYHSELVGSGELSPDRLAEKCKPEHEASAWLYSAIVYGLAIGMYSSQLRRDGYADTAWGYL